ncbi:MAG: serine hydrolase domain-containing protein [Bacteroidota bacterium]
MQALPGSSCFIKDSLDNYINRGMKQWNIPGVSVAIVKDGKTVFIKGYGLREIGKPDKVDANTLFMIGSNTKAFNGNGIAKLEADKKTVVDRSGSKVAS